MEVTKVLNISAENKKHWLNHLYYHAMIGSSILLMTGCEGGAGAGSTAETEIESTLPSESQSVTEEVASSDEIETASEAESQPVPEVPQLPGAGKGSVISCRMAGCFSTAWSWTIMKTE